ncbi:hypothetical protein B0J11DRAFT_518130 [Dendryphion nanum]|uniref:Uncharacterized protein n=1 Tax=Dendryphion nanum TaxID=256645 RepID=A0A9P9ED66_9PLEO|nr:hypothetical protein B0J11DRAFT_518130 [Dendryphion nanum]
MASYFDAQPHTKRTTEREEDPNEKAFGRPSLLSPQVTSILDELENHSSSSSDGDAEESEVDTHSAAESNERKPKIQTADEDHLHKVQTSPLPKVKRSHHNSSPRRKEKPKQPRFARFHSLRSMLFQSNIERNIQSQQDEEYEQDDAAAKWKGEHENRRGLSRPKTPESPKGSPPKDGFSHRVGNKLRRLTSKDAPTMTEIQEDDRESTASSDDEGVQAHDFELGKKHDEILVSDDESIHHSDVEDLVRWVSRRDPPSDGESRKKERSKLKVRESTLGANDSGHESLGHSDVDDLVHWVSRKPGPEDSNKNLPSDYSEASTESDSERGGRDKAQSNGLDDEDVDELVRWVSRREGSDAGPVRKPISTLNTHDELDIDSDHSELKRWVTKEDNTSGESDVDVSAFATAGHSDSERGRGRPRRSLSHKDVDELVRWVGETNIGQDSTAEAAKQPADPVEFLVPTNTHDTRVERPPLRETLTHNDVDDLVKWVSRRHDSGQDNANEELMAKDDSILKLKKQEDEKKAELGMTHDKGSLQPEDVDKLVSWVSQK